MTDAYEDMPERITFQFARWKSKSLGNVDCLWDFDKKAGEVTVGLSTVFRKTKRKTEGSQHFAFPEISRENRGCLVLHSGNSLFSLSLRAGLGQNLSEAKLRKSTKYPGGRRVNSRYARVLRKIPGILPIWPKIWLILGPNQPQTRLRAQNLTISTQISRKIERKREGVVEKKGKENRRGARGKLCSAQ